MDIMIWLVIFYQFYSSSSIFTVLIHNLFLFFLKEKNEDMFFSYLIFRYFVCVCDICVSKFTAFNFLLQKPSLIKNCQQTTINIQIKNLGKRGEREREREFILSGWEEYGWSFSVQVFPWKFQKNRLAIPIDHESIL
jgi:hypothetical protein